MSCIYSDGKCDINESLEDGVCVYDDDPDPSYGCEAYESDWVCVDCGHDLNVSDCDCDVN
jgi:hypothetical protein